MLGLHCTHFLRPQYPSTSPPLFTKYPRTVHEPRQAWFYCPTLIVVQSAHHALPHSAPSLLWRSSVQLYNGLLRSRRKITGKTAVQQSPSRQARRSPSPRCGMWLPRGTRGQWKTTKTPQQPITQSWQHGAQTTSAHLYWCGADPSGPWPAPDASHRGHCPERIHMIAILAGIVVTISSLRNMCLSSVFGCTHLSTSVYLIWCLHSDHIVVMCVLLVHLRHFFQHCWRVASKTGRVFERELKKTGLEILKFDLALEGDAEYLDGICGHYRSMYLQWNDQQMICYWPVGAHEAIEPWLGFRKVRQCFCKCRRNPAACDREASQACRGCLVKPRGTLSRRWNPWSRRPRNGWAC